MMGRLVWGGPRGWGTGAELFDLWGVCGTIRWPCPLWQSAMTMGGAMCGRCGGTTAFNVRLLNRVYLFLMAEVPGDVYVGRLPCRQTVGHAHAHALPLEGH